MDSTILCNRAAVEETAMNAAYTACISKLIAENPNIMELEADLGRSLLGNTYATLRRDYPMQLIDCGIQEANMIGVASGLSATGKIPFCHSFAAFASRRIADQVFISGCYSKANIRIIGSDPGITSAFNGGTHMPFEDISIYKAFPEMVILDPTDSIMLKQIMPLIAYKPGMYYMRLFRKNAVQVYLPGTTFEIGKSKQLLDGDDVTIIAEGILVAESLKAAKLLREENIHARVVDMFTIKPLDEDAVIRAATETGAIVTAENHNVINGLGSSVADVLSQKKYAPLEKIGVYDLFGEVGPMDYLFEKFHLSAIDIAQAAKRAIERKENK